MTTPTDRSAELQSGQLSDLSPEQQRKLLHELLRRKAEAARNFPMSSGQQGLWYAFRRDPSSTAFNVFLPSRVISELDSAALQNAINFLVDRHPCLRTTFSDTGGELRQQVHDSLPPGFDLIESGEMNDDELRDHVLAETQRPFDLETGPLLRMAVFRRGPEDCIVVATTHHIVVDFWSLILLLSELREVYRCFASGVEPSLPPAPGNYASFVSDQQTMIDGELGARHWQHWRRNLEDAPPVLNWFTDLRRPESFTGQADVVPLTFSHGIGDKIKRIASKQSTTTTAVVMAALQVFISRYTREKDFLIGSPFSGRGHRKFEDTVGFFVNMLPLRADLTDDPSFATLVDRVGQTLVKALEHESFPLAEIVRRIGPPRDSSRSPLFQVTCTFEKSHLREESGRAGFLMPEEQATADVGGMKQESYFVPHPTCHHDIEFIFEQTDETLRGMICYCRDLFDRDSATRMAANFTSLIDQLVQSPNASVDMVPWGPEAETLPTQNATGRKETVVEQLEESFRQNPYSIAMVSGEQTVTYKQLDDDSRKIACSLALRKIGRGDIVPVIGRPGPETTTAIVGVIRSGAAVVPIDADRPAVDLHDLIHDTTAKLVIVDESTAIEPRGGKAAQVSELIKEERRCDITPAKVSGEDLAYVIYTSGSTGRPKGVMIEHAAIANTIRWRIENVSLSSKDRILILLSHQFDAGFGIAISTLAQGAALHWPGVEASFDVHATIEQIRRDQITVLPAIPSLLRMIADSQQLKDCNSLLQVWSGGESMPADLPFDLREQTAATIWNFYGPTETAVEATACTVTDHDPRRTVPIGAPIANTNVLILDDQGRAVPNTVPGQIAIAGHGLARGYLNEPERTDDRFVSLEGDTTGENRMYLTGDLGRRRADGSIEFLGRTDHQIKLRGYRIELEEIENVMRLHPSVANAAAKVIKPDSDAAHLAAFITFAPSSSAVSDQIESVQRHVTEHLPAFKRPTAIVALDQLPVLASGKVDRARLPDDVHTELTARSAIPPSTAFEQHIADRWSEMLELEEVGVNQNFFELGGSSLQAAMMTARLTDDLGVHVPTALLFDLADIAAIAQRLAELHSAVIEQRFGKNSVAVYRHTTARARPEYNEFGHPLIARLSPLGDQKPIFMIHPPGGIVICYRELASALDDEQPLLAIRSRGLHGSETLPATMTEMATDYVQAIRTAQPSGPYVLGGWSLGGVIAYEVARQLIAEGESIERLILLDSTIPEGASDAVESNDANKVGLEYGIDLTLDQLSELDEDEQLPFLWQHAVNLGVLDETSHEDVVKQVLEDLKNLFHHHVKLTSEYRIKPLDVPILLVRPTDVPVQVKTSKDRGWGNLARRVDVQYVSGHHHSMVQQPHVTELADVIQDSIRPSRNQVV